MSLNLNSIEVPAKAATKRLPPLPGKEGDMMKVLFVRTVPHRNGTGFKIHCRASNEEQEFFAEVPVFQSMTGIDMPEEGYVQTIHVIENMIREKSPLVLRHTGKDGQLRFPYPIYELMSEWEY